MSTTPGDPSSGMSAGMHVVDGETYEIRYVDASDIAMWAGERAFALSPEDIPPSVYAYLD
jgi:hypothetical protein